MTVVWSNLPDEIIQTICNYWCSKKEMTYRRLKKLKEYELDYITNNSKIYTQEVIINKLLTLQLTEHHKREFMFKIGQELPHIYKTEKMIIIEHSDKRGNRRFNFTKHIKDSKEYNWFVNELRFYYNKVLEYYFDILADENNEISKIVITDMSKECKRLIAEDFKLQNLQQLCPNPFESIRKV
jgi:hypothetical protein